jgi:archaellum component FlaC
MPDIKPTNQTQSGHTYNNQSTSVTTNEANGIVKPLRERVKDLEEINEAHQKKNGQLRVEIQNKNKKIEELLERINNPLKKMRGDGDL